MIRMPRRAQPMGPTLGRPSYLQCFKLNAGSFLQEKCWNDTYHHPAFWFTRVTVNSESIHYSFKQKNCIDSVDDCQVTYPTVNLVHFFSKIAEPYRDWRYPFFSLTLGCLINGICIEYPNFLSSKTAYARVYWSQRT